MKKFLKIVVLLSPLCLYSLEGVIEARGGYFYFVNSTARKIYNQGTPDVELESFLFINDYFNPWINLNYIWKEGRSKTLADKTDLKMGTFSFGSKIFMPYCNTNIKGYLGFGVCSAYLQTDDHCAYLPNKTSRWGVGLVGKSGLLFDVKWGLFLDLFFDYYYLPIQARSSSPQHFVDLGGFRTGIGIGPHF